MAKRGDVVELRGGERIEFVTTTADSGGELIEVQATYQPAGKPPPLHHHPAQEERFIGVRGTVTARVGDVERTVGPGEELVIPPGVDHTFWNPGGEEAVVRWQVRPALRTERMWEELGAAKSGLAAGAVLRRHTDEFRLASPLLRAGLSLTRFRA